MAPPLIEVRDLWRIYELEGSSVAALRGVSLDVARGESVAIMGASGSGKSTLLNVLGCLDRPTRGSYRLGGRDVAMLSANDRAEIRNRQIGFVFQSFNLLPRTSAIENVELPLVYAGAGAAEQRERATSALRAVGLEGHESRLPTQLSGGEQQRVAIARALVNRPTLLLADEPTGNLDSRASREILEIFQALAHEQGLTLVVVTHEAEVARCVGRVLSFRDGGIVSDLRQEPVEARTALGA